MLSNCSDAPPRPLLDSKAVAEHALSRVVRRSRHALALLSTLCLFVVG